MKSFFSPNFHFFPVLIVTFLVIKKHVCLIEILKFRAGYCSKIFDNDFDTGS